MPQFELSLIVPTLNEAANLPELCDRVQAALSARNYELLIIDDKSCDDTPAVAATLATQYPLRLIIRENPRNGLSGAVLHGIAQSTGEIIVVMDADLQHPPERLPDLIAPVESNEADFTIASRHVPGASVGENWSVFRKLNSRVATLLARPFAGKVTDPMSGFFCLRRDTLNRAERLTPLGYKIALELMCKCRVERVKEIPIHFATRQRGESKLTMREQFRYLEHLSRLYDFCFPRLSPVLKFLIVTACGWLVGLGVYQLMLAIGAIPWTSVTSAYFAVICSTAVFHFRYIRTQREFLVTKHPWGEFTAIATAEWCACALTALYMLSRFNLRIHALELFAVPFTIATLVRYVLRKEFMHDIRGLRKELRAEENV